MEQQKKFRVIVSLLSQDHPADPGYDEFVEKLFKSGNKIVFI